VKLKFKEIAKQVDYNMIPVQNWLKVRTKKMDLKCKNCGKEYKDNTEYVGMLLLHEGANKHICQECGKEYAKLETVENCTAKKEKRKKLLKKIEDDKIKVQIKNGKYVYYDRNLSDYKTAELEEAIIISEKATEELKRIEKVEVLEEYKEIEQYLIDEYDIVYNFNYLKEESQIEEYFSSSDFNDRFECGQGYYSECDVLLAKVQNKYYWVTITAEIGSSKQDRGDRLYWVESIDKVTWEETEKPNKKDKVKVEYNFTLTKDNAEKLEKLLKENGYI